MVNLVKRENRHLGRFAKHIRWGISVGECGFAVNVREWLSAPWQKFVGAMAGAAVNRILAADP
jgi:hypothetical protein